MYSGFLLISIAFSTAYPSFGPVCVASHTVTRILCVASGSASSGTVTGKVFAFVSFANEQPFVVRSVLPSKATVTL